jgi:hypothetical protein
MSLGMNQSEQSFYNLIIQIQTKEDICLMQNVGSEAPVQDIQESTFFPKSRRTYSRPWES